MFTIRDADGAPVAGSPDLDARVRAAADEIGGYVTDEAGNRVYPEES